jgi:hypothetical protein
MTHWDCEPSWNFVPQEFALPETLTTLRKMVIEKKLQNSIFKTYFVTGNDHLIEFHLTE